MNPQISAHTKGPWSIGRYKMHIGFSIWASGQGCIAERWYDSEQAEPYGAEMDANAKLIASAPELLAQHNDLLAALKGIMGDIESGLLVRDITKDGSPKWAMHMLGFINRLNAAKAAIAKATESDGVK
jgi:hypothetical protein